MHLDCCTFFIVSSLSMTFFKVKRLPNIYLLPKCYAKQWKWGLLMPNWFRILSILFPHATID